MKETISTDMAPKAIGPYAQGVSAQGKMVFVSGQIPVDAQDGHIVSNDVQLQTQQCLKNIEAVLKASGCSLSDVVKTTVYVKNMDDFSRVNDTYANFFMNHHPARACVEVSRLPRDVLVEIDAIAVI